MNPVNFKWVSGPRLRRAHCIVNNRQYSLCYVHPWGGWDLEVSKKSKCKMCEDHLKKLQGK